MYLNSGELFHPIAYKLLINIEFIELKWKIKNVRGKLPY